MLLTQKKPFPKSGTMSREENGGEEEVNVRLGRDDYSRNYSCVVGASVNGRKGKKA